MKSFLRILFLFLSAILLLGCAAGEVITRNYYILEYFNHSEKQDLIRETPFDYSVVVSDAKVSRTYDRRQIVIRHFGPRITYSDTDLWGVKLEDIIADLIAQRFRSYNIFDQIQREFLTEKPDYEILTTIHNIELYESEHLRQARLNITFALTSINSEHHLIDYQIDREVELPTDDVDTFVQKINDLLLEETDIFIAKTICYFDHSAPQPICLVQEEKPQESYKKDTIEGRGLLLLPALTKTDDEPHYRIFSEQNNFKQITEGKIGEPIPLPAGTYSIVYGSGNENLRMIKNDIEIIPRYKTIIEPDWGTLIVNIIDEKRNYARVRYEIFDTEEGQSYGSEFPVDEEIGEQQKVWILPPGLYKITINNEPFNTLNDFSTVYIQKGSVQKFTIVVATDEEGTPTTMVGSGVLEEDILEGSREPLKISSAIHGNLNLNSSNEAEEDETKTAITFNAQLENHLIYDNFPMHFNFKHLTEAGITKDSDDDIFRVSSDDFDLKNTAVYYFMNSVGIYGRFDLNTHLFQEKTYFSNDFNYIKKDKNGNEVSRRHDVDLVTVKNPLFPLVLKEGLGVNLQLLNRSRASLSLRAGFGMRQELNNDVFTLLKTEEIDDITYRIYSEIASKNTQGTEFSLIGSIQLPFNLNYSTNAYMLKPFDPDENYSLEWEHALNLRLFKYVSLDYKVKLKNKNAEDINDYIVEDHSLFLRLTYFLR